MEEEEVVMIAVEVEVPMGVIRVWMTIMARFLSCSSVYGESANYPPPAGGNGNYSSGNAPLPTSFTGGPTGYPPSYGAPAAGYGGSGNDDNRRGSYGGAPGGRDSSYGGGQGGPPSGRDSGYSGGRGGGPTGRDSGYGVGAPRQSSGGYGGSATEGTEDVKQCDENCGDLCDNSRIYISNLPTDVTIDELKDLFGGIGQIARIKQKRGYKDQWPYNIKLYTDDQGNNKGDGVLSYEDPSAAHSAGGFYNNYELRGHKISVTMAAKSAPKAPAEFGRGGGGRGGYGAEEIGGETITETAEAPIEDIAVATDQIHTEHQSSESFMYYEIWL
ncbi:unnamed protein product [Rhodiola kirilowii]